MAYQAAASKTLVLRAKSDTILLISVAGALTFALSYTVHSHRLAPHQDALSQQAWAGALSDVNPDKAFAAAAAPVTSASLVVSKAELALPQGSVGPLVRLHGCDGSLCASRPSLNSAPTPPRRQILSEGPTLQHQAVQTPHRDKPSLMARMNPFNHLPDSATLKRPFTVAGDTVMGWFKHF